MIPAQFVLLSSSEGPIVLNLSLLRGFHPGESPETLSATLDNRSYLFMYAEVAEKLGLAVARENLQKVPVRLSCGHTQDVTLTKGESTKRWLEENGSCFRCRRARGQQ